MRWQFLNSVGTSAITVVGATYLGFRQMGPLDEHAATVATTRASLSQVPATLKHAFINQPVEVANLRPELASLVDLPGRRPDIGMRFSPGQALPYLARRPVEAVLV